MILWPCMMGKHKRKTKPHIHAKVILISGIGKSFHMKSKLLK